MLQIEDLYVHTYLASVQIGDLFPLRDARTRNTEGERRGRSICILFPEGDDLCGKYVIGITSMCPLPIARTCASPSLTFFRTNLRFVSPSGTRRGRVALTFGATRIPKGKQISDLCGTVHVRATPSHKSRAHLAPSFLTNRSPIARTCAPSVSARFVRNEGARCYKSRPLRGTICTQSGNDLCGCTYVHVFASPRAHTNLLTKRFGASAHHLLWRALAPNRFVRKRVNVEHTY